MTILKLSQIHLSFTIETVRLPFHKILTHHNVNLSTTPYSNLFGLSPCRIMEDITQHLEHVTLTQNGWMQLRNYLHYSYFIFNLEAAWL